MGKILIFSALESWQGYALGKFIGNISTFDKGINPVGKGATGVGAIHFPIS